MSSEIENRLDDLFGENDIQLPHATDNHQKEDHPLAELKNLILSIDWEITDEVLTNLLQQIKDLLVTYEHDKIVTTFLQILNSLGNYIRTHRAQAHPKTFKILNSVFSSLDKVVLSNDMTEPAKKKILRAEMNRYKELRTQIAKSKTAAAKPKAKPVATQVADIKEKEEEPVIKLDKPSAAPDVKEKAEEPVLELYEPSAAPDVKEKAEEPVFELSEPSAAPDVKGKAEEPVFELSEPSAAPDVKGKAEEPVLELYEHSVDSEIKDPEKDSVISLTEPSEPPAVAAKEDLPVSQPDSQRDLALAAIADAVAEIKQYIHFEIKALREEIQSLREQQ